MEKTHYEKIIELFFKRRGTQQWIDARSFQNRDAGENFVGYEAGTDIAVLHRKCPAMFEKRRSEDGKYIERRFRFEAITEIYRSAPFGLGGWIARLAQQHGLRIEPLERWVCARCETPNPSYGTRCMGCFLDRPQQVKAATLFDQ